MSDFDDFDAVVRFHEIVFWIIIGTVVGCVFLCFIICIIFVQRYRRNTNPGTIYTSPVVITSQQHYPAAGSPNVVVNPIVYAPPNTGYQPMQMQQQPQQYLLATAPQMEFGQNTQGPPSYQQATYFQHQEAYNPEYRKQ
ncbi:uncharacterized protein LOC119770545 [Culex quinquefasciatus]|uniref:uncharacterized protein LOC119770545 n=1 Tax=Culex quinquefasciatus TaxID=7176 RepID=UPI0018E31605|nr:uncharacterized protein LOC119770545 [Culex quinquefasciatus]